MKITLSKKQWETIGRKTGWMKKSQWEPIDPNEPDASLPRSDEEAKANAEANRKNLDFMHAKRKSDNSEVVIMVKKDRSSAHVVVGALINNQWFGVKPKQVDIQDYEIIKALGVKEDKTELANKAIGWMKVAGWLKEAQSATTPKKECHKCRGTGAFEGMPCSMCKGKGYVAKEDSDSYYHSMGVAPCPHKKAQIIPDDGIADGGEPYTKEEMDLMELKESKKAKIDAIKNSNDRTEKLLKLLELYFSTYPNTTGKEVKTFWNNIYEMSLDDMNKYIDNFVSRW